MRLVSRSLVYGRRPARYGQDDYGMGVANGCIVLTHDLDFGTLLALTHATGPSVLQVRADDVLPDSLSGLVIAALRQHEADLASGALMVVDESKCRVRILPI